MSPIILGRTSLTGSTLIIPVIKCWHIKAPNSCVLSSVLTIKPILITLTLPITLFTLGIAYPLVNVIILYITSFILGNSFNVSGFFAPLFISIIIYFLNILMEGLVIKPIIQKGKNRR